VWPAKRAAEIYGDIVIGGLHMIHEREDAIICGPVMPQGGLQALMNQNWIFLISCTCLFIVLSKVWWIRARLFRRNIIQKNNRLILMEHYSKEQPRSK
jgi:hypothetical protein